MEKPRAKAPLRGVVPSARARRAGPYDGRSRRILRLLPGLKTSTSNRKTKKVNRMQPRRNHRPLTPAPPRMTAETARGTRAAASLAETMEAARSPPSRRKKGNRRR